MPANVSIAVSCEPERKRQLEEAIAELFRDHPAVMTVNLREESTDDSWEISVLNLDGKRVWQHTLAGAVEITVWAKLLRLLNVVLCFASDRSGRKGLGIKFLSRLEV